MDFSTPAYIHRTLLAGCRQMRSRCTILFNVDGKNPLWEFSPKLLQKFPKITADLPKAASIHSDIYIYITDYQSISHICSTYQIMAYILKL